MIRRIASAVLATLALCTASPVAAQSDAVALKAYQLAKAVQPVSGEAAAVRVLRSAAGRITPIATVMASPPTITQGAANAASPISGAPVSGVGSRYPITSAATSSPYFDAVGGLLVTNRVRNTWQAGAYAAQHPGCLRFATRAAAFAISLGSSGGGVAIYVTDPVGTRARATADDIVLAAQPQWLQVGFGSAAIRVVEVCFTGFIYGIDVPSTDSIWRAPQPGMARLGFVMDSYGVPAISLAPGEADPKNSVRLGFPDHVAAGLGVSNPLVSAFSGTGIINNNGTPGLSFMDRVSGSGPGTGDMDVAKVGELDLIFTYSSGNDGSQSDAALYTATIAYLQRLMTAQPRAVIVFAGFQVWASFQPSQARFDNIRAACEVARSGDMRVVCLDNGPAGENWLFGTTSTGINSIVLGVDGVHPSKVGGAYLGERVSRSIIMALRARYGL